MILVLIGLAQCGSATEDSSTPDPAETSETAPPASEPIVAEPDPEPAYVPDYSDDDSSSSGSAYYRTAPLRGPQA